MSDFFNIDERIQKVADRIFGKYRTIKSLAIPRELLLDSSDEDDGMWGSESDSDSGSEAEQKHSSPKAHAASRLPACG